MLRPRSSRMPIPPSYRHARLDIIVQRLGHVIVPAHELLVVRTIDEMFLPQVFEQVELRSACP